MVSLGALRRAALLECSGDSEVPAGCHAETVGEQVGESEHDDDARAEARPKGAGDHGERSDGSVHCSEDRVSEERRPQWPAKAAADGVGLMRAGEVLRRNVPSTHGCIVFNRR